MNQHIHNQDRDISSSEDHCRCEACRNQEELKMYQRQNPTNIYMFKHLKKRGVPPVKKELLNKESTHKAKHVTKKQELEKKLEHDKALATPTKHKLSEALRAKETSGSSFFIDYHQVSHSQRQKVPSKDLLSSVAEQPRRIVNSDDLRNSAFNKQNKIRVGFSKLVEISENPENIRTRFQQRSASQASATSLHEQNQEEKVKSLQKIKN